MLLLIEMVMNAIQSLKFFGFKKRYHLQAVSSVSIASGSLIAKYKLAVSAGHSQSGLQ